MKQLNTATELLAYLDDFSIPFSRRKIPADRMNYGKKGMIWDELKHLEN